MVENDIRPTALGKKNWLFIGHPDAGKRTAILYSIIISCLRHGHDPEAYIRDLLTSALDEQQARSRPAHTLALEGAVGHSRRVGPTYDGPALIVVTNLVTTTIPSPVVVVTSPTTRLPAFRSSSRRSPNGRLRGSLTRRRRFRPKIHKQRPDPFSITAWAGPGGAGLHRTGGVCGALAAPMAAEPPHRKATPREQAEGMTDGAARGAGWRDLCRSRLRLHRLATLRTPRRTAIFMPLYLISDALHASGPEVSSCPLIMLNHSTRF